MSNYKWLPVFVFALVALLPGARANSEEEGESEPADAVLFLFLALALGILFRKALSGLIVPYTGVLLV